MTANVNLNVELSGDFGWQLFMVSFITSQTSEDDDEFALRAKKVARINHSINKEKTLSNEPASFMFDVLCF